MTTVHFVNFDPNKLIPWEIWPNQEFPLCNVDIQKYDATMYGSEGYKIYIICRSEFKIAIVVTNTVDIYAITQKSPSDYAYVEMMGIVHEIISQ